MNASPNKLPANPEPPSREYPFAHDLCEGINRSRRKIDQLNIIQIALLGLAFVLAVIALLL